MAVAPQPKLIEDTIPEGDEYLPLRATLNFLKQYFPDVYENVQGKVPGWIQEITAGNARDADQIRDDIFKFSVGVDRMVDNLGITPATAQKIILGKNEGGLNFSDVLALPKVQKKLGIAPGQAPKGVGEEGAPGKTDADPGTLPGVLRGGRTIQVGSPSGPRYYQMYEIAPGQWAAYQFSSLEQAEAALGSGFQRGYLTQEQFRNRAVAEAQAEEVIGLGGNWNQMMNEITFDAAKKMGVNDPSLVGQIANDPEMRRIAATAAIGDWTPAQILAEQRKTDFWMNKLYPGIKNLYASTSEPERAWANYRDAVTPALTALGYKRGPSGGFNIQVAKMLDAKIDAQTFLENVPIFQQAVQNQQFFDVYKQRAAVELGKNVTFGDWFSVLKGEAAPDLMKVAEGATVAYQAKQADFGLNEAMLQRLIAERDLSQDEARNVFSEVNQAVLALGETGLSRGGLNRDDILSAAAAINPASGLSQDEVRLKVAKLAQENDLFDEDKLQFYVGFDAMGRPTRPGLASLAPEAA